MLKNPIAIVLFTLVYGGLAFLVASFWWHPAAIIGGVMQGIGLLLFIGVLLILASTKNGDC